MTVGKKSKRLDRIEALRKDLRDKLAAIDAERKKINDEYTAVLHDLREECPCTWDDGSSAWEGGFMFSECKICGKNDL